MKKAYYRKKTRNLIVIFRNISKQASFGVLGKMYFIHFTDKKTNSRNNKPCLHSQRKLMADDQKSHLSAPNLLSSISPFSDCNLKVESFPKGSEICYCRYKYNEKYPTVLKFLFSTHCKPQKLNLPKSLKTKQT